MAEEKDTLLDELAGKLLTDPYEQRDFLDVYSKSHLPTFAEHVLGYNNSPHHLEWYGILENKLSSSHESNWDAPLVPSQAGEINDKIVLLAPRSHSKSTCFTVNYPLWRIGNNPNIRILIVSATNSQAVAFLREIKNQMIRNPNYRRVFGDLFPSNILMADKWTDSEIIVRRDDTSKKDSTVAVTSAGGGVLGRRADLIICDDILNEKIVKTADQRAKTRDWFNSVLMPVLEPDGKLIVVGTVWNVEDLYHEMMKQNEVFKIRKRYKAVINEETKEVLWSDRWSYETLMQRKSQMGSLSFNKSYQNEAMSAEDAIFQLEWLDSAKARGINRTFLTHMDYATWDMGKMTIVIGVDLAISQKDDSDYTAMVVLGRTQEGMKIPLFMLRERLTPKQTRDWIVNLNQRYLPDLIMVESNGYQKAIQLDLAEYTDLPIRSYNTGNEKFDIDIGLNSLAVEMENEKWILPYSDTDLRAKRLIDVFVDGCLTFPSGHTEDLLMATWFANAGLRSLLQNAQGQQQGSFSSLIGR